MVVTSLVGVVATAQTATLVMTASLMVMGVALLSLVVALAVVVHSSSTSSGSSSSSSDRGGDSGGHVVAVAAVALLCKVMVSTRVVFQR